MLRGGVRMSAGEVIVVALIGIPTAMLFLITVDAWLGEHLRKKLEKKYARLWDDD